MKKNKKLIYIIGGIGALLIVLGVACIFLWPKTNEKKVFTDSIQKAFGIDLLEVKDKTVDNGNRIQHVYIDGSVITNGQTYVVKDDIYAMLGKVYMKLLLTKDGQELDADLFLEDNRLYFTIKDYLEKMYYMDINDMYNMEEKNDIEIDVDALIKILKDDFYDIIDGGKLDVENTTKNINGKDYKAKKYSYVFTGKDVYQLLSNVIEDVKKDKTLYAQLEKVLIDANSKARGVTLDIMFSEALSGLEGLKDLGDLFTYTTYIADDKVISTEVQISLTASMGSSTQTIPIIIVINNVEKYYQAYASAMGMKLYELVIDRENGKINLSSNGQAIVTGTISDTKITLQGGPLLEKDFSLVLEKSGDNAGLLSVVFDGITASFNIRGEEVKEFPKVDVSSALHISEVTEKDKEVLEKLFPTQKVYEDDLDGLDEGEV